MHWRPSTYTVSLNPRRSIQFRFFPFDLDHTLASDTPESMAALAEKEVHFWSAHIPEELGEGEAALLAPLSADERTRADRFRVKAPRCEYIVTRYILRHLLSNYLRLPAADLVFAYLSHGKPHLPAHPDLQFSVSHSHGLAVFAFARHRRVGVDVEKINTERPGMDIAERFFSPSECRALHALPPAERGVAFFRIWTRKESFIKGLGSGLSHPLRRFDVSLKPGEEDALLATRPDATDAARWWIRDAPVPQGHAAAVAVEIL